jgi:hypothetical protein
MTYGAVVKVPAPIQAYEASHAEVEKAIGGEVPDGMIFHVARATDEGFEVFEVWESQAQADKFNEEVVVPAIIKSGADMSGPEPARTVFEPVGMMLGKD